MLVKIEQLKRTLSKENDSKVAAVDSNQEREMLLQQVKDDNQEIAVMERKIQDMQTQMKSLQETLGQQQQFSEEASLAESKEKIDKIEELLRRDSDIQSFLDVYDEKKKQLETRISASEKTISQINHSIEVVTTVRNNSRCLQRNFMDHQALLLKTQPRSSKNSRRWTSQSYCVKEKSVSRIWHGSKTSIRRLKQKWQKWRNR